MCKTNVSGILGPVKDWLAILEATAEFLEADLKETVVVRKSKFNKSMAMRKAKMKFGKKKQGGGSIVTMAQKKQRKAAAKASAKSRTGKKVIQRLL